MNTAAIRWLANGAILLLLSARTASGAIDFPVTFSDPGGTQAAYYANLTSSIQAAGKQWARFLGGNGSIEVEVSFSNAVPYAPGGSVTTGFVRNNGTRDIFEQGAIYELRTGMDVNGATPDIHITINPDYLTTNLWFDPNPTKRTDPIPPSRTDALSVFVHELGHAFVFNGWMNGNTGQLPATYMSTFDEHVIFDGTDFFFTGDNAKAGYGNKNVPITFGIPFHLGNNLPRPGSDLIPDLMNGIVFTYQVRYRISALDLKIMKDCGATTKELNLTTTLVTRLANGHMQVSGNGEPNTFVRIDAASSPGGAPSQIATASTDGTGAFQFEDTDSGSVASRFYFASYP